MRYPICPIAIFLLFSINISFASTNHYSIHIHSGNYLKASQHLHEAVAKNDAVAMYYLGRMYVMG